MARYAVELSTDGVEFKCKYISLCANSYLFDVKFLCNKAPMLIFNLKQIETYSIYTEARRSGISTPEGVAGTTESSSNFNDSKVLQRMYPNIPRFHFQVNFF
jgi:hypothetical protein